MKSSTVFLVLLIVSSCSFPVSDNKMFANLQKVYEDNKSEIDFIAEYMLVNDSIISIYRNGNEFVLINKFSHVQKYNETIVIYRIFCSAVGVSEERLNLCKVMSLMKKFDIGSIDFYRDNNKVSIYIDKIFWPCVYFDYSNNSNNIQDNYPDNHLDSEGSYWEKPISEHWSIRKISCDL